MYLHVTPPSLPPFLSTHLLKVALERRESALKEMESERDNLASHSHQLEGEVASLRRANEEAMQMRSLALEERSKVSLCGVK